MDPVPLIINMPPPESEEDKIFHVLNDYFISIRFSEENALLFALLLVRSVILPSKATRKDLRHFSREDVEMIVQRYLGVSPIFVDFIYHAFHQEEEESE